ncbi:hypothetical protein AAG747_20300 [Rapidithrix thailandica]|uniref:DUF4374 domain-containing protein n=1 Tax=Rapidithrix thailandica TaxID=413964 RepID=A0AAW9RZF4_9BACT
MQSVYFILVLFIGLISCKSSEMQPETQENQLKSPENIAASAISVTYTAESDFINGMAGFGFLSVDQLSLNRSATANGYNSVYGFNIPANYQQEGFKWNSGDQATEDWRPQGISGFTQNGRRYLVVTWYGIGPSNIAGVYNQHKGVRISLIDITNMNDIKYRLLLLVQDKDNMSNSDLYKSSNPYEQLEEFAPVTIHAGGVACYNNLMYVADTKLGIRVFDLNKFVEVESDPSKNRIGKESDGTLKAFNYRYVLPQVGYYKITNGSPFSCISLGNVPGSTQKMLWTGQYIKSSSTKTPQIFGFRLNSQGQIQTQVVAEVITPKDKYDPVVYNMQGVYRMGDITWMAITGKSSYQGSTARMLRYHDGTEAGVRYRWPHGAEDLYYEESTGYLWNLTEYESSKYGQENRAVFAVKLEDYL